MSTKAKSSLGSKVYILDTDGTTYLPIGEVNEIGDFTADSADDIDVTSFDSGDYKESIRGQKTPPEIQITANYVADDDGQLRILDLYESGANAKIKLVLPDKITVGGTGRTVIRDGYVKLASVKPTKGAQIQLAFTWKTSGTPTITAAS